MKPEKFIIDDNTLKHVEGILYQYKNELTNQLTEGLITDDSLLTEVKVAITDLQNLSYK